MRPSIATVVGPGWEPRLVDHARSTGLARLVGRCCDPAGLTDISPRADAIFIGSEAHWLASTDLRHLRPATRLIGVATDEPGARLLDRAGVDDIVDAHTPPAGMLSLALSRIAPPRGRLVEVTGPRGAPGRSEIALAAAFARGGSVRLVEVDHGAPSLGLRMGLRPSTQRILVSRHGVDLDPVPAGERSEPIERIIDMVNRSQFAHRSTILDAGPDSAWHLVMDVDDVIVVGEATDVGLVRLARLCEAWLGPEPQLVINRYQPDQDLRLVRRATGLEPVAVIPALSVPARGEPPVAQMVSALRATMTQRTAL